MEQGLKYDTAETVKSRVVGNTGCGEGQWGSACQYFAKDGSVKGKNMSRGATNSGTYEIKDDGSICVSWSNPQWRGGCTKTMTDPKTGHAIVIDNSGAHTFTVKEILPGNAKSL